MSTYRINLTIDENFQKAINYFKSKYPLMSEVEIVKMGFGGFYAQNTKDDNQKWINSLPELKLTDKQMTELESGIEQSLNSPKMTFETSKDLINHLNLAE